LAGSLAIVPLKIIWKLDLLLVPLAFAIFSGQFRSVLGRFALFGWGIAACLLALAVFAANLQFLSGRNTGFLLLCAVPFVSFGLWQMMQRYPRWRALILLLAVLTMIANLKAFGPNSRYYVEAGAWLSSNIKDTSRVYNDSGRMLHYAGWYKVILNEKKNRSSIAKVLAENKYDYFVLEVSPKDPPIQPWLEKNGLKALKHFGNPSGKGAVVVAVPEKASRTASPSLEVPQ
ncbi:membrane protein, partial [sediment metagenome]